MALEGAIFEMVFAATGDFSGKEAKKFAVLLFNPTPHYETRSEKSFLHCERPLSHFRSVMKN